jgi:hypothetical protein
MKKLMTFALAGALSMTLVACGGGGGGGGGTFGDAPEWYDNPTKGCGVGSAKHRGIRDLTRKAAVSSARDDLGRNLKSVVQGMIKQYQSAGEAEGKEFAEELQTRVTRSVVDQTLVGTRTVATAMRNNEFYAMVCLDPETFADAFDRMKELDGKQKAALKKRAEKEFEDLDAQIEKLRAGN